MNDRVRFKFWDKVSKVMLDWDCVCQTAFNHNTEGYGLMYRCFTTPSRFIPIQYTGLKDKNGKLVYEKDILLSPDNDEPYMVIVEWGNEKGYIVKAWNGKEFEYALSDDTLESLKYFQIIGNEFENPELLEERHE